MADKKEPQRKTYNAVVYFEQSCERHQIDAFSILHHLRNIAEVIEFHPVCILEDSASLEIIQNEGLTIKFTTEFDINVIQSFFAKTTRFKDVELSPSDRSEEQLPPKEGVDKYYD